MHQFCCYVHNHAPFRVVIGVKISCTQYKEECGAEEVVYDDFTIIVFSFEFFLLVHDAVVVVVVYV